MPRLARTSIIAALLLALLAPTAIHAFNSSYAPTAHSQDYAELSSYACSGKNRTGKNDHNDVVRIRTTMSWNSTQAQNVRNYAASGKYYTHDITDMSNNLDGFCLWTNFPNAYYDWDDDSGETLKWEESEVAAINKSFPTANTNYSVNSYFARWTYGIPYSGGGFQWFYDPDGGQIKITPQISEWWGSMGEYNTAAYDGDPRSIYYGSKYRSMSSASIATSTSEGPKPRPDKTTVATLSLGKHQEYTVEVVKAGEQVVIEGMYL